MFTADSFIRSRVHLNPAFMFSTSFLTCPAKLQSDLEMKEQVMDRCLVDIIHHSDEIYFKLDPLVRLLCPPGRGFFGCQMLDGVPQTFCFDGQVEGDRRHLTPVKSEHFNISALHTQPLLAAWKV